MAVAVLGEYNANAVSLIGRCLTDAGFTGLKFKFENV